MGYCGKYKMSKSENCTPLFSLQYNTIDLNAKKSLLNEKKKEINLILYRHCFINAQNGFPFAFVRKSINYLIIFVYFQPFATCLCKYLLSIVSLKWNIYQNYVKILIQQAKVWNWRLHHVERYQMKFRFAIFHHICMRPINQTFNSCGNVIVSCHVRP